MSRPRTVIAVAATAVLAVAYLAVAWQAIHPNVGKQFRAYYIDHTVVEWHTNAYVVPESDGIRFANEGRPNFVEGFGGVSAPDPDGRWTDERQARAATVVYKHYFHGLVCAQLKVKPSPANVGGVSYMQLGSENLAFPTPTSNFQWHRLTFDLPQSSKRLRIYPGETERMSAQDPRVIGLKLNRLIVTEGAC